jgi:iron complex transport system permease protein
MSMLAHRRKQHQSVRMLVAVGLLIPLLLLMNIAWGTVSIPLRQVFDILFNSDSSNLAWNNIVWMSRMPQSIAAMLAGAALAACGLMMQTLFRNPLADPSILGISTGANLGVAILVLALNGTMVAGTIVGYTANILAAFVGAMAVLLLILALSAKIKNTAMLLIVGIMIGFMASSIISILNFYASKENIQIFVLWGLGDFSNVTWDKMPTFTIASVLGILFSLLQIKPLNALLLGESYASNLGVNVKRARYTILLSAGLLIAAVTAFCGPISFIGLAVPHVARMLLATSNHKTLLPVTILLGSAVALLCNLLTTLPGEGGIIPINAVTSMLGAPVVIYVIFNRRKLQYFS